MSKSELEDAFLFQLRAANISLPLLEYRFHPDRKWRFDFAWPRHKLAAEIEGGLWTGGRHVRAIGFVQDCEKYNEAVLLGWRILRLTGPTIESGQALAWTERALRATGAI